MDSEDLDLQEAKPYPSQSHHQPIQTKNNSQIQCTQIDEETLQIPLRRRNEKSRINGEKNLNQPTMEEKVPISTVESQAHRKRPPSYNWGLSDIEEQSEQVTRKIPQQRRKKFGSALQRYFLPDFEPKKKETKGKEIKEIKLSDKEANCKGQIIFIWDNQWVSEKWASTQMSVIEIYDGTASILVFIPQIFLCKLKEKQLNLDKWISISGATVQEKRPNSLCLLVTETTLLTVLQNSQHQKKFEPGSLGTRLNELERVPKAVKNIICLVIKKEKPQIIRNKRGEERILTFIHVLDPRSGKMIKIKLWEEKTKCIFYFGLGVYLLREIEQKSFEGKLEYSSSMYFNYRMLRDGSLNRYLRHYQTANQSIIENWLLPPMEESQSSSNQTQIAKKPQKMPEEKPQIMIEDNSISDLEIPLQPDREIIKKAVVCKEIKQIKIVRIDIDEKFLSFFWLCGKCKGRVFTDQENGFVCYYCGEYSGQAHYAIKFCYIDEDHEEFQGQIRGRAAQKLVLCESKSIEALFFQGMTKHAKQQCLIPLIGKVVNGVILSITHQIQDCEVRIKSNFLVDVLPINNIQAL